MKCFANLVDWLLSKFQYPIQTIFNYKLILCVLEEEKQSSNNLQGVHDPFTLQVGQDRIQSYQNNGYGNEDNNADDDEDEYESDEEEIKDDAKEVIKLVNVHKTYLLGLEGVPALRGVNLTINDGEFITILGTSGGGKTTLLNIIGTIDKPSKGDVYICGLRIKYSTKDQLLASIRLNKLGFVF